jgi:hypothetical protein
VGNCAAKSKLVFESTFNRALFDSGALNTRRFTKCLFPSHNE